MNDQQLLRAACAIETARENVSLFLSVLLYAPCEEDGGRPLGDRTGETLDLAAEQRKACPAFYPDDEQEWCWPCKARELVNQVTAAPEAPHAG